MNLSKTIEHPVQVPWRAVTVFIVTAFATAWLIAIPLWLPDIFDSIFSAVSGILPSLMMLSPLMATLIVVLGLRSPPRSRRQSLGIWPLTPTKRVVWFAIASTIAPLAIVLLSIIVSSTAGWIHLDLTNLSGLQSQMHSQLSSRELHLALITQVAIVPVAAIFNGILAFGEEVGWRGWLLPALQPLGTWPALLISGAIWGLWHAPVTLLGHNFNEPNLWGVTLMTVGGIAWGIIFGWLRLRSGSLWPAVLAHGSVNASGGLVLIVGVSAEPTNLALINPFGVSGWITIALIVVVLIFTGQFKRETLLGQSTVRSESGDPSAY